MLSNVLASSFVGVKGYLVNIEVDVANGLPSFQIVGLGDTIVVESKERVRTAIKNSGYDLLPKRIVVNLSPADIKKEGSLFDLGISVGVLTSLGLVKKENLDKYMILGELSLSGKLNKTKGIINSVITAKENNLKGVILPKENADEAYLIKGIDIIAAKNLKEAVDFLNGDIKIESYEMDSKKEDMLFDIDFSEVKGQEKAKRAFEIASAGAHNIFMLGSPGSGKSMMAKRMITILPDMEEKEIIETTKIYSIAGMLEKGIIRSRPFRSPHHTASDVAIIGGGKNPKPGEISLAHNGILFLDESFEFSRNVIEVMRQPLEDGKVNISRANFSAEFPADFILIMASNPCNCGNYFEDGRCSCTPQEVRRYQKKVSGPILDRIDLYIEIRRLSEDELLNFTESEKSKDIKDRVTKARFMQYKRFGDIKLNSQMNSRDIRKHCKLDMESKDLMRMAGSRLGISGRGFDRILKLARTIADLEKSEKIEKRHIAEAISYRKTY